MAAKVAAIHARQSRLVPPAQELFVGLNIETYCVDGLVQLAGRRGIP